MAVDAVAFSANVRRPLRIDDRVVGYAIPHFTLDERRPVIQTLQRIHRYTEWIVRSIGN